MDPFPAGDGDAVRHSRGRHTGCTLSGVFGAWIFGASIVSSVWAAGRFTVRIGVDITDFTGVFGGVGYGPPKLLTLTGLPAGLGAAARSVEWIFCASNAGVVCAASGML
jgi:hypothetical protein